MNLRLGEGRKREVSDRLAALQRSAPEALQMKIRTASAQVEGERKPVTILFTDIVGSTSLAERLDPEEWKEIVSDAHRIVSEGVYRYEGTIAQLLGDGVLAFFGAPITHEDDPIRAVRAGLDIQRSVAEYSQKLKGYVDNFQMRIGINTGTVIVGSIGSDMHMEYLAIGDSVNLAARLQSAAEAGTVLIAEGTARLVRAGFELKGLGEITVKGKTEPVAVYEVEEAKAEPESGRGIEGLTSPLVGRERELQLLREALVRLDQGEGQVIAVMGEAGIGKTRLVEEARGEGEAETPRRGDTGTVSGSPIPRVQGSAVRWLEGRSLSYGHALSFWAITQLIKSDLGLSDAVPEARIRSGLRRRASALFGERVAEVTPYLAHLLGTRLEGEMAERVRVLDGETLKRQTLLSIAEYFEAVAKVQPTVLVFEDMHWADPSTLEALQTLFPLTDRVPLMILMLMRLERDHGSWRLKLKAETDFAHRYTEIMLEPLSPECASQLVNNLLEIADIPAYIRDLILERSEGNPFYLEEVIRSLIEQGAIVHEGHRWRATKEIADARIPETLQGVLLARIDRLEDDVRRTLQLASVIGKSFLFRLLEAVAEGERELDEHLAQLQRVDLVREKTRRPELEYIFKHSLTQEAAYNSLLVERRKEFHRKVGVALEQLFAGRMEEFYGLLAHHFDVGGEREKAADYLIKAGDKARLEDAQEEAVKYYERATGILDELGDSARATRTWLKLALVHHTNFQFDEARHCNEIAFALERKTRKMWQPTVKPQMGHPVGIVHLLLGANPRTIDPGKQSFFDEGYIACNVFAGLAEIDAELNVVPDAARSWEVQDEGTRYVFHLRDDVRWTEGTPVTALDFEWAWKRNLAPATGAPLARQLYDVVGARDYREGRNPDPESVGVKALDALTLEVRLATPVAYFPYVFAQPLSFPLPRHVVERYGDEWWKPEHFVSNGAYRLIEFGAGGMVWERNADYFGEFTGNVERLEVRVIVDRHERMRAFLRGEGDIAAVHRQDLPSGLESAVVEEPLSFSLQYMVFNPLCPPLGDVRVRRALVHAIDRERVATIGNAVLATGGLVPTGMPGHSPGLGLQYDPRAAQRLLAEAGYRGGSNFPPLRFELSHEVKGIVQEIARQWRKVLGVEVELKLMPPGRTLLSDPTTHLAAFGWVADYPDPDNFLRQATFYGEFLKMGVLDPRYSELVEAAARARDRSLRMRMYREADRLITMDQVLIVPFFYGSRDLCVVIQPRIKGFTISPLSWPPVRQLSATPPASPTRATRPVAPKTPGTQPLSGSTSTQVATYQLVTSGGAKIPLLVNTEYTIGRHGKSATTINLAPFGGNADQGISRKHARLVVTRLRCFLEDLGSKNGTFVNDRRLASGERCALSGGEQLRLGLFPLVISKVK